MRILMAISIFLIIFTGCQGNKNIKKAPTENINKLETLKTSTLISLATDEYNKKQYKKAKEYLDELKKRGKENFKIELLTLKLQIATGNFNKADKIAKEMRKKYPKSASVYFYSASLKEKQHFYYPALKYYLKAYKLGLKTRYTLNKITTLYMRNGRYHDAIRFFQTVLMKNQKLNYVRYNLAMAYFYTNQYDSAITQLKLLAIKSPRYSLAYYGLGTIYAQIYKKSHYSTYKIDAIKNLKKFLKLEKYRKSYKIRARKLLNELK